MTQTKTNVNPNGKFGSEINVKRLGEQQKQILRFLYENQDKLYQQVEIIESVWGEVTNSRKASVSRSMSKLQDNGLVMSCQKTLMTPNDHPLIDEPYYNHHRIRFGISQDGMKFVESDSRFPEISGGGEA